jgi:hypothetical protein
MTYAEALVQNLRDRVLPAQPARGPGKFSVRIARQHLSCIAPGQQRVIKDWRSIQNEAVGVT